MFCWYPFFLPFVVILLTCKTSSLGGWVASLVGVFLDFFLCAFAYISFICCIVRSNPPRGSRQQLYNRSTSLYAVVVFTSCVCFLHFCSSYVLYISHFFASFVVARVSHDDEAKLSRERRRSVMGDIQGSGYYNAPFGT